MRPPGRVDLAWRLRRFRRREPARGSLAPRATSGGGGTGQPRRPLARAAHRSSRGPPRRGRRRTSSRPAGSRARHGRTATTRRSRGRTPSRPAQGAGRGVQTPVPTQTGSRRVCSPLRPPSPAVLPGVGLLRLPVHGIVCVPGLLVVTPAQPPGVVPPVAPGHGAPGPRRRGAERDGCRGRSIAGGRAAGASPPLVLGSRCAVGGVGLSSQPGRPRRVRQVGGLHCSSSVGEWSCRSWRRASAAVPP